MPELNIRQATFEDMDFILSQAKEEGWNPGLHDAIPFYNTDPHGFFIGLLGEEKIGCISAVAYNSSFGFMGFYIVLPAYRGRGFGHQLWAKGLEYLGQRVIGLDGVLKQQHSYEQTHFELYYKNYRFEGHVKRKSISDALVNLTDVPFEMILNYDLPIFGLQREVFLKHWIAMPDTYSFAKVKDGQVVGYGVLRKCYKGYKVGPLFTDNAEIAAEIFESLCSKIEDASVYLDIPEINSEGMQMAEAFGLKSVFATVRMYNKTPPKQQINKIFGVTTFEIG